MAIMVVMPRLLLVELSFQLFIGLQDSMEYNQDLSGKSFSHIGLEVEGID